jgi:RimJ/RimL family protein N-acetyltransferase
MIRDVTQSDLERVRAFLEAHVDTSLFLLSNLAVLGPRLGDHLNSGNYRLAEESGRIVAVFCLTRRGNLLVQAGGRADLAQQILEACESEPMQVRGVIGEWATADALWRLLGADPRFEPTRSAKDVLYRLMLGAIDPASDLPYPGVSVRALEVEDFDQWERLNTPYLLEQNLPVQGTLEERKADFAARARARMWWGALLDGQLIATAGLSATYRLLGQVGGVYTRPEYRKQGFAQRVMRKLIEDCGDHHLFERLILFTNDDNSGSRRLYESLGFELAGAFGVLLGARRSHPRTQLRHKWAGQSGEVYTYEVYEWPSRLSPRPGNFVLVNSTAAGDWHPVLIGESADLSALAVHDRLHNGRHKVSHVHVRLNFNPAAVRRREVSDLTARWMPPAHDVLE